MSENLLEKTLPFVANHRWGVLSTIAASNSGYPFGSLVNYLFDKESKNLYFFLSKIAVHHKNLIAHPSASLFIMSMGDTPELNTPRINLSLAISIPTDVSAEKIDKLWDKQFPDYVPAEIKGNFNFFEGEVKEGYFIAGFAKVLPFSGKEFYGLKGLDTPES